MYWSSLISDPEARAIMASWRERFVSGQPFDAAGARAAVEAFYQLFLGGKPWGVFVVASPEQALLAMAQHPTVFADIGDETIAEMIGRALPARLSGGLRVSLAASVRDLIVAPAMAALPAERLTSVASDRVTAARDVLAEQAPHRRTFAKPQPITRNEDVLNDISLRAIDVAELAGWCAQRQYLARIGTPAAALKMPGLEAALDTLCRVSPFIWMFPGVAVVAEPPASLASDFEDGPQRFTGTALRFRDGFTIEVRAGATLPTWLMEAPHLITPKHIERQPNAEIRRILVERMGIERYIRESGARVIDEDGTGILWQRDFETGSDRWAAREPLVFVEVVNGTPEPDGTFRHYFLRVPPWMNSAREAVAWTYGLRADDYTPTVRT